jgi:SAM-dependent methyltransferase
MELIHETIDLKQLDKFLSDISEGLSMGFGSLFRIANQYLESWGVRVTKENYDWISKRASKSYLEEWEMGSEKTNQAIENAIRLAQLEIGNQRLNTQLAEMVVHILMNMYDGKRTFTICDIGAGAGDTSAAILDAMDLYEETKDLARFCDFYLIEPSPQRLVLAKKTIEDHDLSILFKKPVQGVVGNLETHIPMVRNSAFDIVVSNAVLHHFPFPDHYKRIREKLAADGVMVIGDWHTTMWKHPAFVVPVLEAVGADIHVLNEFKNRFGIRTGDKERLEATLTPMQKEGHKYMLEFVRILAIELKKVGERLYFLEAHEALEDRVANIADARFATSIDQLGRHQGFKGISNNKRVVFETHDLAAVVAVGKLKPPNKRGKSRRRRNKSPQRAMATA